MEEEKKIYTIEDIARELGVSKTTVSRAISGKGRIGQATRERVLQFIKEHDYRPNVMAKGLAQRKTYNLALLLPKDYIATEFPFFKDCMNGICEVASDFDYDIIISMIEENNLSQLKRLESNKKVDGMILSRSVEDSQVQKYLKSCNVPFVVIGPCKDPEIPSVDNQNQEASQEMTGVLLTKGIKKVALLGGNESYSVTKKRYEGFLMAHEQQGISVASDMVYMNADNQLKVTEAVTEALAHGVEGFVCMDDVICNMCLGSLREKKLRIPADIRVASLYDSINLEYNNPPVTSVRFDTVRLGRMACAKLLQLLGENPREELLPLSYQIVLRESTQ